MGYEGPRAGSSPGSFADLVDHVDAQIEPAGRRMADDIGKRVTSLTKANTPVSHQTLFQQLFGSRRSPALEHLRDKIEQKKTIFIDTAGKFLFETGAETHVEYAPYVEEGTGLWGPKHAPYEIKPKSPSGTLHWIDPRTGANIFAKRVLHPGSPGNHMFAIGVAAAEAHFDELVSAGLREFKRRAEAYHNGPV